MEKHETYCDYQTQQCSVCQSSISKKDFSQHVTKCTLVRLTCPECKIAFTQDEMGEHHTDVVCLKEQLRQLRQDSEENKRRFEKQSEEYNLELQKLRQNNDEYTRKIMKIQEYLCK